MSLRAWYWVASTVAVAAVAVAVGGGREARGFGVLALILASAVVSGVDLFFLLMARNRRGGAGAGPRGGWVGALPPAEGGVGGAKTARPRADLTRRDSRFRRFVALEPDETSHESA